MHSLDAGIAEPLIGVRSRATETRRREVFLKRGRMENRFSRPSRPTIALPRAMARCISGLGGVDDMRGTVNRERPNADSDSAGRGYQRGRTGPPGLGRGLPTILSCASSSALTVTHLGNSRRHSFCWQLCDGDWIRHATPLTVASHNARHA